MKYLVLNGSPRGSRSTTMIVTNSFIEGVRSVDNNSVVDIANLSECSIIPCRSCYVCWSHFSEGECVITKRKQDDMADLMNKFYEADNIIMSTPMHFFNISSHLQKFIERTFPLIKPLYLPTVHKVNHNDLSSKGVVVISTCKVAFEDIWSCIDAQMKFLSTGKYQSVFSTQPIPLVSEDKEIVQNYLDVVYKAGQQFALTGVFSDELKSDLQKKSDIMAEKIITCNLGI
jgi:multimeric flavodoxin WrbA